MRDLGLVGRVQFFGVRDTDGGRFPSVWAVLARSDAALGPLSDDQSWEPLVASGTRTWSDDFSNLWSVINWRAR
jgi:hypothetical protein